MECFSDSSRAAGLRPIFGSADAELDSVKQHSKLPRVSTEAASDDGDRNTQLSRRLSSIVQPVRSQTRQRHRWPILLRKTKIEPSRGSFFRVDFTRAAKESKLFRTSTGSQAMKIRAPGGRGAIMGGPPGRKGLCGGAPDRN